MEDGKLIITVEYIQHRAFAMRDHNEQQIFGEGISTKSWVTR